LRQAYDQAESGIRQLSRETSVRDFRARSRLQLSSAPVPLAVLEGGEYQGGTFAEAQETYSAARFGRMIGISIETLVNDDVGAFNDLARRFGQSAAAFEAQFLVDLLTSNAGLGPVMADTEKLFDAAAHGNIPSSSAIDEDALSAARLAMRSQTGLVGEVITVTPRYLLVPPALETTAEKIVATIQAATTDAVNPFTNIRPIVEPRLTDAAAWYLVADPASVDGLEHTYVEGLKGPTVETERDFNTDGLKMKVRMTYGAGFVDWRGWQRNAGG
jgi:hypothetical protein